ncbi:MAG TPA: cytidine deaminase [Polyangiaceae bacterium]|nr:cytidine deaminase [Polyangiaceae bacterium]
MSPSDAEPAAPSPEQLLELARRAAAQAHAPYSRFRVGAAVVAGGRVFSGCNVENASYGLCMCAERVAAFKAVSEGCGQLSSVAVSCVDADAALGAEGRMPCGACRQVLAELGGPDLPIHVDGVGTFALADLLPRAFRLR